MSARRHGTGKAGMTLCDKPAAGRPVTTDPLLVQCRQCRRRLPAWVGGAAEIIDGAPDGHSALVALREAGYVLVRPPVVRAAAPREVVPRFKNR